MSPDPSLVGWYYKRNGVRIGPMPIQKIESLLRAGELGETDMLIEIAAIDQAEGPGVRYSYVDAASAVQRDCAPQV